jgi:hypothetical protein
MRPYHLSNGRVLTSYWFRPLRVRSNAGGASQTGSKLKERLARERPALPVRRHPRHLTGRVGGQSTMHGRRETSERGIDWPIN